ncbi:MAG TPA: transposase, partial [Bacteroidales bacterium]|nr:transposase [Bacteroidales bacterium]
MKTKNANYYPDDFKLKVIREVLSGRITKEEARRKYQLGGKSAVLIWMRKFGIVNEPIPKYSPIMESNRYAQTKEEKTSSTEIAVLKKKIEELELKLEYERLRTEAL